MISALHRVPRNERRALAQEWARRSNAVQAEARMARDPDLDTIRSRALHDARGQLLREGCTYRAGRVVPWQVVRSRAGRTNQIDIIVAGRVWRTCGNRTLKRILKRNTK